MADENAAQKAAQHTAAEADKKVADDRIHAAEAHKREAEEAAKAAREAGRKADEERRLAA